MLIPGTFLQDRYEIIDLIGSGGMADVYKAKCHKLNRFVAIKVLKKEYSTDKNFVSKFRVEAQSAAGLMHPNIVNVYDVGEENGMYYFVMELVEGITLKNYIEKKIRLTVKEALSIAIQVSMGIEAAHNNGIIHRDIKPQNIIISKEGKVKVADFGIAKAASSDTVTSHAMGSVHYTSPEQARGGYSDAKSDIYSIGITLFEMVTGHVPFDGETTVAIAIKHIQEEMPSPTIYVPDVPISVERIISKCTQKNPDRRYQNTSQLINDLKHALTNPDEDFVVIQDPASSEGTKTISDEDRSQIRKQTVMQGPVFDNILPVYGNDKISDNNSNPYDTGNHYDNQQFNGGQFESQQFENQQYDNQTFNEEQFEEEQYSEQDFDEYENYEDLRPQPQRKIRHSSQNSADYDGNVRFNTLYPDKSQEAQYQEAQYQGGQYQEAQYQNEQFDTNKYQESPYQDNQYQDVSYQENQYDYVERRPKKAVKHTEPKKKQIENRKRTKSSSRPNVKKRRPDMDYDAYYTDGLEDDVNPKMENVFTVLLVLAAVVVAVVAILIVLKLFNLFGDTSLPENSNVEAESGMAIVPNVVGLSVADASKVLKDAGLSAKASYVESAEYDKDYIVSQDIEEGTQVAYNSILKLEVSSGKVVGATVPDVVGKSEAEARVMLEAEGFSMVKEEAESDSVEKGNVISQSPLGAETAPQGSAITVVISSGSNLKTVVVPDLTGKDEATAKQLLTDANLTCNTVTEEESDTVAAGLVISQTCAANEEVPEGTVVDIVLSSGPAIHNYTCSVSIEAPPNYLPGADATIVLVDSQGAELGRFATNSFPFTVNQSGIVGQGTGLVTVTYMTTEGGYETTSPAAVTFTQVD